MMTDNDDYIVLVTYWEKRKHDLKAREYVSHGINNLTGRNVILPCEHISQFPWRRHRAEKVIKA